MEINSSNPLNIQLASFARTLEWKLKKQNEEKQSEYIKLKELCKTKEKPLTITNVYYSGQVVGTTCTECHPNVRSIFQKSFTTVTLKDLLHETCNKYVKKVVPSKQEVLLFHQCSARSSLTYYFMRAASWVMYHTLSFWYKGILIHPEHIDCIKQAQETGSSLLFFISTPSPDVWTLCSLYFALYYSGLRPPELCGFENLPWFTRLIFSRLGCLHHGADPASIITHSVAPFYSDYVNFVIDDIYIIPVAIAFDQFIHVNLATPYALSDLDTKYGSAELEDENDVNGERDIDDHIKTDCSNCIPVSALCFVAYVVIARRTCDVIDEDTLYEGARQIRAALIRDKVHLNFKGKTENIVQCALELLSPYIISRRTTDRTEFVIKDMKQLFHCAKGLVMKKLLVCLVASVVYSFGGGVCIASDDVKIELDLDEDKGGTNDSTLTKGSVKHRDILSKSLQVLKQVEKKLNMKLLKYCQSREDEINKTIGELSDYEILLSTEKAQLEEERWCQNIVKSLEMDNEDSSESVDKRCYNVEKMTKSPLARNYINIASILNHV